MEKTIQNQTKPINGVIVGVGTTVLTKINGAQYVMCTVKPVDNTGKAIDNAPNIGAQWIVLTKDGEIRPKPEVGEPAQVRLQVLPSTKVEGENIVLATAFKPVELSNNEAALAFLLQNNMVEEEVEQ